MTPWYRSISTYSPTVKGRKGTPSALKPVRFTWTPPRYSKPRNIMQAAYEAIERAKESL